MELKTERLTLRDLLPTDLDNIHLLLSFPETARYNTTGIPETIEDTKKIFSGWINAQAEIPEKRHTFLIESNSGDFVGLIGLIMGKPGYSSAEMWYKLHPEHWNKGLATEAVKRLLHYCLTDMGLHRVEAGCAVLNIASSHVLQKAGMLLEGKTRKKLPIGGEWLDGYNYAILDEEYHHSFTG